MSLELACNAVTGRVVDTSALEQRCELTCSMAGEQHEDPAAIATSGKPLAHHLARRARIRRHDSERGAQPAIQHGEGRLVGIEQSKACMLRIGVNLCRQQAKVLPAIYRRKRH